MPGPEAKPRPGWLDGKAALVTGGASGIGRAIVERFVLEGARVCACDISAERLEASFGGMGEVLCVQADVTRAADNRRAVATAVKQFGRLDVFVGNAGIFDGYPWFRDLPWENLESGFDEVFNVNVKGCLLGALAALPELAKTGGNMIFTVSSAGFYPDGGGVVYTASKHALVGLIRQLAFELAPAVRVNGVAPGGTLTALAVAPSLTPVAGRRSRAPEEKARRVMARTPLRMAMEPADHAAAYVLLASDQARSMTGIVIESDGGIGIRGMAAPPDPRLPPGGGRRDEP